MSSSASPEVSSTRCPQCGAALATTGIAGTAPLICSVCRTSFNRQQRRLSQTAIIGLLMGLSSVCCMFTGIPAMLLSVIALREIKSGERRGKPLAVAGIVTGATGTLLALAILPMLAFIVLKIPVSTRNPQEIQAILAKLPAHDPPPRSQPVEASEFPMMRVRWVAYRDPGKTPQHLTLLVHCTARDQKTPRASQQAELALSTVEGGAWNGQWSTKNSRKERLSTHHETAVLIQQIGAIQGATYHRYIYYAATHEEELLLVTLIRGPPPAGGSTPGITREQFQAMIDSIDF